MSWMELSLDTTHEAVDWVCTLLAKIKDIDDVRITEYADPNLSQSGERDVAKPSWTFTIRFYLNHQVCSREQVEKIANLLLPLNRTGLATELQISRVNDKPTPDEELNPFVHRIGQRFVILTPDTPYQAKAAGEIPLRLKTTLSFGSGLHPATMLSLQLIERYIVPSMNILDLGSGSGILSIAMAKLGATVLALDNDRTAVQATQDSVYRNNVEQQVTVMEGSLGGGSELGHWMGGDTTENVPKVEATERFDVIVANILARVHIALADDFHRALRRTDTQPGLLITAGFTTDYEQEVVSSLTEAGFETIDCERLNEWVAFAYRLA
ncbi:50S ribosomal protein L11 methyltransferase [Allocoleopsis franciscana]|uniref:Ribosomal protein L11 methylase n=1 Tax=Allocoleopsis franciscana PCC 7113 TaxID=1173027 RepID=K9WJP7_9CYAN|nr:50S ribosomal protein L11 methyltransferase [Allocoleopsis franciscana]AFZ20610.1 ribosomal protein L11 methylase [Allocoleopsis franciscana PCC 7113]